MGFGKGSDFGTSDTTSTIITSETTISGAGTISGKSLNGEGAVLSSAAASKPNVTITNTTNDSNGPGLTLKKDRSAGTAADDDNIGTISWYGDNDAGEQEEFARITTFINDASNGTERGKLRMSVAEYDGTVTTGFEIRGDSDDGVIDWTLGAGANSFGNVTGDLGLGHDAAVLYFGADEDITMTHVADTGLAIRGEHANGTNLRLNNAAADGDPRVEFQLGGTTKWSVGCEDGDSDKFVIENGNGALGAAPALEITSGGEVNIDSPGVKLAKGTTNNTLNFGTDNNNGGAFNSTTGAMGNVRAGTVVGSINATALPADGAAYGNVACAGILATDTIIASSTGGFLINVTMVQNGGFFFTAVNYTGGEVGTGNDITFNWVAI
jgi:hypothetical protein